jgi:hypothetical protein
VTTIYPFTPTSTTNFSFMPTLNGTVYSVVVTWNYFGQRYYINVSDLAGDLICSVPMVGSPTGAQISSMLWANGIVMVETATPHGFTVGSIATVTITGTTPAAYNGQIEVLVINGSAFQFDLADDPGATTALGSVSQAVNLVGAFFPPPTSLIFRQQAQQFEAGP